MIDYSVIISLETSKNLLKFLISLETQQYDENKNNFHFIIHHLFLCRKDDDEYKTEYVGNELNLLFTSQILDEKMRRIFCKIKV